MKLLITALFGTLCQLPAAVVNHGPLVHWSEDPAKSTHIVWLERAGEVGIEGQWAVGRAGFGYGDDDDATVFPQMKDRFLSIAIRRLVKLPPAVPPDAVLVLRVNYDDGFIAWLGGKEIARRNVNPDATRAAGAHEAGTWEEFRLGRIDRLLTAQGSVLALQGFNQSLNSSDFTLHPVLVAKSGRNEWPIATATASWEYLANAAPGDGWQTQLADLATADNEAIGAHDFSLRHRSKGTTHWSAAAVTAAPFAASTHRVLRSELKSLPGGKDIEFQILSKAGESPIFTFRMPPAAGQPIRFVTGGDVYHSRGPMDQMNRIAGKLDPLFALIGGDLAYADNGSHDRWFDYFDSWAEHARAPDGRLIPKIVAIGNHEIKGAGYHPTNAPDPAAASMFYSLFQFPEPENATHTVDFGDWLSIVNLDSGHTKNIATQTGWLDATLRARRPVPNLFVCYHRPAWGVGAKPDAVDIQREWCPLFEKHRVTAVFENDHHVFSRSHPLSAGRVDPENGIPYLGSGSWSVRVRQVNPKELEKRPWIAKAEARNHLYLIETQPHGYTATAIDLDGTAFDQSERVWKRN